MFHIIKTVSSPTHTKGWYMENRTATVYIMMMGWGGGARESVKWLQELRVHTLRKDSTQKGVAIANGS